MTKSVLEWLASPKNIGQMRDADAIGKTKGNENCKDVSKLFVKVEKGKIAETKFQTYGGVASIVATSVLSEIIKGKTMAEAAQIGAKDIYAVVGFEAGSEACVENALSLVASLVANYEKKQSNKKVEEKPAVAKVEKAKKVEEQKPQAKRGRPAKVAVDAKEQPAAEAKDADTQKQAKQQKPSTSSVTIIAKDNAATQEVEVDIFSEIDALTAKISEAVNKMKKK